MWVAACGERLPPTWITALSPITSPVGDIIGELKSNMRATVALDDELIRKAQELSGLTERTALLREALKALIHLEASRRLAAVGGTEPDLEDIKRVRADDL
jgi:Arc/MetJ family transcription regulator